jgi:hypothetical protein
MLEQLAPAASAIPLPSRRLECRVYQRLSCELPGYCQPASALGSNETRWPATARDLSQGGICLQMRRRYEPGAGLAIELPATTSLENVTFFVKVVNVRPEPDGLWSHGCRFVSPLSQDELKRLVGPELANGFFPEDHPEALPGPSAAFPASPVADSTGGEVPPAKSRIADVQFQLVTLQGTVVDCPIKQLAVPSSWPLGAGKKVTIRAGAANKTQWTLKVEVVHCALQGERWTLRCRLATAPAPGQVLRALSC